MGEKKESIALLIQWVGDLSQREKLQFYFFNWNNQLQLIRDYYFVTIADPLWEDIWMVLHKLENMQL